MIAAEQFREAGAIDQAIALLEAHRERDPAEPVILETLGFMYTAAGDETAAAFAFIERYESSPDEPEYLLYAAQSLRAAGDTRGAADLYRRFLAREANNRAIWRTLAEMEEEAGRFNQAISAYTRVYRMSRDPEVAARLGSLFHGIRNLPQAENWYATALGGDPPPRLALTGGFQLHMEQGRFQRAEEILEALETHFPEALEDPDIARSRVSLLAWRRQQAEAVRLVEQLAAIREPAETRESPPAERRDPPPAEFDAADTAAVRAEPAPDRDTPDRRREPLEPAREEPPREAAETHPPEPGVQARAEQARQQRRAGNLPGAIAAYREILTRDDRDAGLWHELSETYFESGEDAWAEATALEAVRREPDSVRYMLHYLRTAQRTMSPEQLMEELIRAHRRFPDSPDITLVLARGYRNIARNFRNARILYEQFLTIAPDHPQRAAAERELSSL